MAATAASLVLRGGGGLTNTRALRMASHRRRVSLPDFGLGDQMDIRLAGGVLHFLPHLLDEF